MNNKTPIHIYRQYLQTISDYFMPEITMFKNSALVHAKSFGETSNEFLNALVISTHINELTVYFKKRLLDTTKPSITLQLTDAEIVVLYKVLMHHGITKDKVYLNIVRQDMINRLHEKIFFIGSFATVGR
jgi:predicted transcriptional regulator